MQRKWTHGQLCIRTENALYPRPQTPLLEIAPTTLFVIYSQLQINVCFSAAETELFSSTPLSPLPKQKQFPLVTLNFDL